MVGLGVAQPAGQGGTETRAPRPRWGPAARGPARGVVGLQGEGWAPGIKASSQKWPGPALLCRQPPESQGGSRRALASPLQTAFVLSCCRLGTVRGWFPPSERWPGHWALVAPPSNGRFGEAGLPKAPGAPGPAGESWEPGSKAGPYSLRPGGASHTGTSPAAWGRIPPHPQTLALVRSGPWHSQGLGAGGGGLARGPGPWL